MSFLFLLRSVTAMNMPRLFFLFNRLFLRLTTVLQLEIHVLKYTWHFLFLS